MLVVAKAPILTAHLGEREMKIQIKVGSHTNIVCELPETTASWSTVYRLTTDISKQNPTERTYLINGLSVGSYLNGEVQES